MNPTFFRDYALVPALKILPLSMDTPAARALVIAICLQESRLQNRRQLYGPARSYAQFEMGGGVRGVLQHPLSKGFAGIVLSMLDYPSTADPATVFQALEHNDVLCAAFARLLLYTLPDVLPTVAEAEKGWQQYTKAWRPGKPIRETWDAFFNQAWGLVQ